MVRAAQFVRRHEPIWTLLKSTHIASVAVQPKLQARVIKAVTKEKCSDLGWKLMEAEKGKQWKLLHEIGKDLITFTLVDDSESLPVDINLL